MRARTWATAAVAALVLGCGTEANDDAAAAEEAACEEIAEAICSGGVRCRVLRDDGTPFSNDYCREIVPAFVEQVCLPRLQTTDDGKVEACRAQIAEQDCAEVCRDAPAPACNDVLTLPSGSGVACDM